MNRFATEDLIHPMLTMVQVVEERSWMGHVSNAIASRYLNRFIGIARCA
jgi:hypothetical protein